MAPLHKLHLPSAVFTFFIARVFTRRSLNAGQPNFASYLTSRWAVAHRWCWRVGQFRQKCKWKRAFFTKSCRCHKTRSRDAPI